MHTDTRQHWKEPEAAYTQFDRLSSRLPHCYTAPATTVFPLRRGALFLCRRWRQDLRRFFGLLSRPMLVNSRSITMLASLFLNGTNTSSTILEIPVCESGLGVLPSPEMRTD